MRLTLPLQCMSRWALRTRTRCPWTSTCRTPRAPPPPSAPSWGSGTSRWPRLPAALHTRKLAHFPIYSRSQQICLAPRLTVSSGSREWRATSRATAMALVSFCPLRITRPVSVRRRAIAALSGIPAPGHRQTASASCTQHRQGQESTLSRPACPATSTSPGPWTTPSAPPPPYCTHCTPTSTTFAARAGPRTRWLGTWARSDVSIALLSNDRTLTINSLLSQHSKHHSALTCSPTAARRRCWPAPPPPWPAGLRWCTGSSPAASAHKMSRDPQDWGAL